MTALTRRTAIASALATIAAPAAALATQGLPAPTPDPAPGYRGPGVYLGEGIVAVVGAPIQGFGFVDGQFVPKITIDRFGETCRELRPPTSFAETGLVLLGPLSEEESADLDAWIAPNPDVELLDAAREVLDADAAYARRLDQRQGREQTEADEADLSVIGDAREAAGDRTLSIAPHTVRGARAVLQVLATYQGFDMERTRTAIALLLESPVLAG